VCFGASARPPEPPVGGRLVGSGRRNLTSGDGTAFAATLATTTGEDAPGIVVLPDVRGLHPYYEDLAGRLADAGVHALAIDLYGRTAGAAHRDESFEYAPHRAAVRDEEVRADVAAAAEVLRAEGAKAVHVMGFCFGGRAAFMQASQPGVAGAIGFYGWPAGAGDEGRSPIDEARAGLVRAPVLALYGGADEKITPDQIDAYDRALEAAGVPHETVVYPGAPHSFFDRKMADHAEACADAWARILRFVGLRAG
jgi:carboxymethylenebutenolidase